MCSRFLPPPPAFFLPAWHVLFFQAMSKAAADYGDFCSHSPPSQVLWKGENFPSLRARFPFSYGTGSYVGQLKRVNSFKLPEKNPSRNVCFFVLFWFVFYLRWKVANVLSQNKCFRLSWNSWWEEWQPGSGSWRSFWKNEWRRLLPDLGHPENITWLEDSLMGERTA